MNTESLTNAPELAQLPVEAPSMELKIASWLNEQAALFRIPKLEIGVWNKPTEQTKYRIQARAPEDLNKDYACEYGFGTTIGEAVAELRSKMRTPDKRAKEARDKAAALLAEAKKLEAEAKVLEAST